MFIFVKEFDNRYYGDFVCKLLDSQNSTVFTPRHMYGGLDFPRDVTIEEREILNNLLSICINGPRSQAFTNCSLVLPDSVKIVVTNLKVDSNNLELTVYEMGMYYHPFGNKKAFQAFYDTTFSKTMKRARS